MAINTTREDEQSSNVKKSKTLGRLLKYLLDYKKTIVVVLLIMAYCVFVSLYNPILMETAIDDCIVGKNFKGLIKIVIIALVINTVWVLLVKARMALMSNMCNKVLMKIRDELYEHLQTLDFKFFDKLPVGKILSRITGDINSLKNVLQNFVVTLLPNIAMIFAVMVIMFVKNYKLALAAMAGIPILAFGMIYIEIKCHKLWQAFRKKSANLHAFEHEEIAGIKVIKAFSAEGESLETFDELSNETKKSFINAVRVNDAFNSIIDICQALSFACMYYVGIKVIGLDYISVGMLVAFTSYISSFWQPLSQLGSFYNQIITNIAAAERVFEVMDTESNIKDAQDVYELPEIKGSVKFDNVSFSYEDGVKVLKDVSFDIKPGETIALVGPTGAGKTTIVNLISRFYDVQEGTVLVDDNSVKNVSIESLRKQLGIMTQENFLFSGTVKENIRYGKLDATDDEIIAAAKAVNAHDFIMNLKNGYDTDLSEEGGGLSNGQRQLLAFARTMVSDPKILILDEATSSIDTQTELMVQKGIEGLLRGRTSFVIAHRLSTIKNADRIFVIDDGQIKEAGNHNQLLEMKGTYYNLYMAQFS